MSIVLGIDFEHIYHTPAYRSLSDPDPLHIDIPDITTDLLDLFEVHDVSATFFVVSELAIEHPGVIREIVDRGHEIASHTRTHQSVVDCDLTRQRSEIVESKSELESVIDQPVSGFRAPTCRINDQVFELLIEAGYEYSSSVMPGVPIPGYYSNEYDFDRPTVVSEEESSLIEIPLSVNPFLRLPVSGAWIRLLGKRYVLGSIRQLLDRGVDVVTYSHPWEFAPLQQTELPLKNRIRTGEWFRNTYEQLLQFDVEYRSVSELADEFEPERYYSLPTN